MSRRLRRPRRARPVLSALSGAGPAPDRAADDRVRLRARGAPDLLALLPFKLGFHPEESIVTVFVRRKQIALVARVDIPPVEATDVFAADLRGLARRNDADELVLFAYSAHPEPARSVLAGLVAALPRRLVNEALYVDGSRWWSLTCDDACCPAEGTPYDIGGHRLAAEAVFAGMAAWGSRGELAAAFAGPAEADLTRLEDLAGRARATVGALALPARLTRLTEVVQQGVAGLPDDEACAELAALVGDLRLRDAAWAMITRERAEHHLDLWQRVVARVSPTASAAPLALAGMAGWICGHGVVLNCVVDQLARRHPYYSMGGLLATISAQAIPPRMWETIGPEVHREIRRDLDRLAG